MSFLRRFLPKQENFFHLFERHADLIVEAALEFQQMIQHLQNQQQHVKAIQHFEEEGDQIAHLIFQLLHKTFITPFDRNDINRLTSGLDDVLDQINRCAQRFPFYDLKTVPAEINRLAELSTHTCEHLKAMIGRLNSLKKSDEIFSFCRKIDAAESEAHQMVLSGEKNLFLHENHFKEFFKLKEIYGRTKSVIDGVQDVGNVVKGIVLEYS